MNRKNLIDKIRGLMAKTVENGCTEAEALAALARAQAMMDAYEVTAEDLRLTKEEKAILQSAASGASDPHNIKASLTGSVAAFCGCEGWRSLSGFVFCGMRSDAEFGAWLLDALAEHVRASLAEHLMQCLYVGSARWRVINGFVSGCTSRIAERLVDLRRGSEHTASDNSRALVAIKDTAISALMKEKGIKLTEEAAAAPRHMDERAVAEGRRAADKASLGRPVSGAAGVLRIGKGS
ncbi:MAG: DUF2786 domain-containing protein [Rhodopseudomonas sp.]|nr:DUF2786 domain-containing protein [Rhodopseudomonas sp.]